MGRSLGDVIPERNPDALKGALSILKIAHAYDSVSSNPSGTTAWIV
jgi:hypothetical protein